MSFKIDQEFVREALIKRGVRNLREYGYPKVMASNILTDKIYSAFFVSMLDDVPEGPFRAAALLLKSEIARGGGNG